MKIVSQSSQENPEVNSVVFQKKNRLGSSKISVLAILKNSSNNFSRDISTDFLKFPTEPKISLIIPIFTFEIPYMISPESPTKILR